METKYDLTKIKPDVRKLNDMREVLSDKNFAKNSSDMDLYYMYRGLEEKNGLRYDQTVISAKMLGSEFNKTKGHYHIGFYPEVYTVLEGSAIYLLQKLDKKGNIEDVYFVNAKKGDSVIMEPFYGHVTINPSDKEDLKMANWISSECKSDYLPYEKAHGACYYYIKNGWVKNENYKSVPPLHEKQPLKSVPEDLNFLKK